MSRYTGPKCRVCRRLNMSVCGSIHCALKKKPSPPGERRRRRVRESDYKTHLVEKQRLRCAYWVSERQFRRYVREAMRQKGVTGENLMRLLELRLDTVVHRLGFAPTLPSARQLVSHGHVTVNGRKVDRPSCLVKPGDTVAIRGKSRHIPLIREGLRRAVRPPYLSVDEDALRGTVQSEPHGRDIPVKVDDSLVVEYYTKYL